MLLTRREGGNGCVGIPEPTHVCLKPRPRRGRDSTSRNKGSNDGRKYSTPLIAQFPTLETSCPDRGMWLMAVRRGRGHGATI